MNENLNLVEILKDCPKGTKLYSTIWGDVKFNSVSMDILRPINVEIDGGIIACVANDGKVEPDFDGECTLFPSKDQRDWSKFQPKKPKFDPKTLMPFDRVLVRLLNEDNYIWYADFVSHRYAENNVPEVMSSDNTELKISMIIPYNDETKHLVGTTDEAPEFYRYWEE